MKATDFSIIFCIVFMAFYLSYSIGNRASESVIFTTAELNKIMDEIVVDAMKEGYGGVDGNLFPLIDKDKMILEFMKESSLLLEEAEIRQYIPLFVKKIIYVERNGYFVYSEGRWSSKILFETEEHEEKVKVIVRSLSRAVNNKTDSEKYKINIPANSGESYSQTISEYSFLILCEDVTLQLNGNGYSRYFLSGAALKQKGNLDYFELINNST
ncbi:MAG: hypothetical protein HFI34_06335 [Lachnospiraceae bacterium]|nr:hypothetical protein [Lachnospiraceae bacterium]